MTEMIAEQAEAAETAPEAEVPKWLRSDVLDGEAREQAMDMMRRLTVHLKAKTTDQAESTLEEPIDNYLDPEVFAAEVNLVFRRIPLPLALSAELVGKNTFKSTEAVGVPVVITRDAKGVAHAMMNVCRHRGALICEGRGEARALTCPYHAWSFGMGGELKGIYGESTFGDFDKSQRGLIQLPVVEKHGVIWVCLTPGLTIDIDSWLGEWGPQLASLKLDECHVFSSRQMPGPNWKATIEGYLEAYHFAATHPNTVFTVNHGNTMVFDGFGPHERLGFALRTIDDVIDGPESEWDPSHHVGPIFWTFPGFSIAGGWRQRMTVALCLPTTKVDESITEHRIVVRHEITDEVQHELEVMRDWFYDVVYNEDYLTQYGVQKGVGATGGHTQIFGRNEIGVQYLHGSLNRLCAEGLEAARAEGDTRDYRLPRQV
ncbi:MAG: Anthranilate 1,2-dioxygenase large subunit [Actinomycetota bacterium]|jgi:phenylpropionate dioxygenase-like ring-hydroxylating dioxygenase large terminal subunit